MVSIILCTYNRAHLLSQAIESVLNQTYEAFECIVVDDGSTDHTEELVTGYKDPRIQYIKMPENRFYCYTANYGMKQCSGEYIAFLNSDDFWEKDKLEKQVQYLENNPACGACFTKVVRFNEEGPLKEEGKDPFEVPAQTAPQLLHSFYHTGNCLCHPSAMVRKEVLDQTGGFRVLYGQLADYDLWLRILTKTQIHVLQEKLTWFRWHTAGEDQISGSTKKHMTQNYNEQLFIRKELLENIPDDLFIEAFQKEFRNPDSKTPLELEWEKIFLMMHYEGQEASMQLMGMEKLHQLLLRPEALDVLKERFRITIHELFEWNRQWMYLSPDVCNRLGEIKCIEADLENHRKVLAEERAVLEKERAVIAAQKEALEGKEREIQDMRAKIQHLEQLEQEPITQRLKRKLKEKIR